ncbi:DNA-binding response regulator [Streptomyces sp. NPDC058193]|uniref:response regulator transcription factor n=1 Tax=Streptomyces sp. NPDC058193 TaxID=3346373 RepID=UPI0036F0A85F
MRLLIVEDEKRLATSLAKGLTAEGFAVDVVHDGLEQLAQRAGEVVSKADILEHVWDFAYDGDPNIVEVYVSTLRRKLGAASIRTVRGAGYRLETP